MEKSPVSFVAVIAEHLYLRPEMQLQDVYKLLYQGISGPEHFISSQEAFKNILIQEWNALGEAGIDPLTETIRPDGSLRRINLRPYKADGRDVDLLVSVCVETSSRHWGTQTDLEHTWTDFVTASHNVLFPVFKEREVTRFTVWLCEMHFPPVHHSEKYHHLYKPAYRLIANDLLSRLIG